MNPTLSIAALCVADTSRADWMDMGAFALALSDAGVLRRSARPVGEPVKIGPITFFAKDFEQRGIWDALAKMVREGAESAGMKSPALASYSCGSVGSASGDILSLTAWLCEDA